MGLHDLPLLNALLNGSSALLLLAGYRFIRKRRVSSHRACMIGAFACSTLFLASYITYHIHAGSVHFTGTGAVRTFYFSLLASHTLLAAAVPPLAIITLSRGLRSRFDAHRRIAHWTLPVWLYVSVTGVAIYLMLYGLYPAA